MKDDHTPAPIKLRSILIAAYLVIALLFGLYGTFFGAKADLGVFHNMGGGLVWPALLFPAIGKLTSALVWLAVIVLLTLFVSKRRLAHRRRRQAAQQLDMAAPSCPHIAIPLLAYRHRAAGPGPAPGVGIASQLQTTELTEQSS